MTTSEKMDTKNSTEYKDYSLSRLEDHIHDSINCGATAREVFDTIFNVVEEERQYHEEKMGYCADLMAHLKSGGRFNFNEKPVSIPLHFRKEKEQEFEDNERAYKRERAILDNLQQKNLDSELKIIKENGGFEWTPNSEISRNDPARLAYERGWVYESPDNGKTVTKRRVGETQKYPVK